MTMAKQDTMFKLTMQDKAKLGGELAQLENELVGAEESKKAAAKDWNETIEGIKERIGKIAATINQGEAERDEG